MVVANYREFYCDQMKHSEYGPQAGNWISEVHKYGRYLIHIE